MGSHYKGTEDEVWALTSFIKFARAYSAVTKRLHQENIANRSLLNDSQWIYLSDHQRLLWGKHAKPRDDS